MGNVRLICNDRKGSYLFSRSLKMLICAMALTAVVFFVGCASQNPFKGYEGPDAAPNKVATVTLAPLLTLVGVNDIKPKKPIIGWFGNTIVSLKKGTQRLRIGTLTKGYRVVTECDDGSFRSFDLSIITNNTFGGYRLIEFIAKEGHHYEIKSNFQTSGESHLSATINFASSRRLLNVSKTSYNWHTPVFDNSEQQLVKSKIDDSKLNLKFGSCRPVTQTEIKKAAPAVKAVEPVSAPEAPKPAAAPKAADATAGAILVKMHLIKSK